MQVSTLVESLSIRELHSFVGKIEKTKEKKNNKTDMSCFLGRLGGLSQTQGYSDNYQEVCQLLGEQTDCLERPDKTIRSRCNSWLTVHKRWSQNNTVTVNSWAGFAWRRREHSEENWNNKKSREREREGAQQHEQVKMSERLRREGGFFSLAWLLVQVSWFNTCSTKFCNYIQASFTNHSNQDISF